MSNASSITIKQATLIALFLCLLYLLGSALLIGFKLDQLMLAAVCSFFMIASPTTRKFIIGFFPFVIFWIFFDWMKAFPNYLYHPVSTAGLYQLEQRFFSVGNQILCEFFAQRHTPILDVLTGLFYLSWVPVPILFSFFQFLKNRRIFVEFILVFLYVNLIGFVIYYLYPAAPPWYVQIHGFIFNPHVQGNPAGLVHFDQLFGIDLFHKIYSKSSNVFAAMPSLHSAYPVVLVFYSIKAKCHWLMSAFFFILMLGIWFSAVYLGHHYVLDVLAGILCAGTAIGTFYLAIKYTRLGKWVSTYITYVQ